MPTQWLQSRGFGPLGLLLWGVSLSGWGMILAGDGLHLGLPAICGGGPNSALAEAAYSLDFTIRTIGGPALASGIALMVIAMMAPALAGPVLHLWYRSLSRHRWRAIALFSVSYLVTWMIACACLMAAAMVLHALLRNALAVGSVVGVAGLVWQICPARARCLARCHLRPRLSIFGVAALADPLAFGITLAGWCIATCWALMLLPLCLGEAQLPLMAAGTLVVASERFAPQRPDRSGVLRRLARLADLSAVQAVVRRPHPSA
jgi:predicted metal-binding membrane protein